MISVIVSVCAYYLGGLINSLHFLGDMWIGLSSIAGNWYWTHFQTMSGEPATFTNWGSQPETGTQAMSTVSYSWEGVDPNEQLYAMCETESSWTETLNGKSII